MANLLRRGLRAAGYVADTASTGEDAVWMANATRYDAIVLDVMLPGIEGFETSGSFAPAGVWTPVLMLTARESIEDRVAGLDGGADDYLTKPFAFAELLARLRALARRGAVERPTSSRWALRLDPGTRQVWRGEAEIELSTREFALLETLMRSPADRFTCRPARAGLGLRLREPLECGRCLHPLSPRQDRPPLRGEVDRDVRGSGYRLRRDGGDNGSRC